MIQRIERMIKQWLNGLLFPFREPDWLNKMWLIAAIGFVLTPFVQVIALKGWKVELVRRVAVGESRILPPTDIGSTLRYFVHGIKLWFIAGVYVAIPWILFRLLGVSPFALFYEAITSIGGHLLNSFLNKPNPEPLSVVLWAQFWNVIKALIYNAAWLIFYLPYYKAASLRYALTGKMRKSHLQVGANIAYMTQGVNFRYLLNMIWQQIIDKISLFVISLILSLILTPFFTALVAPFIFYADFWTSGYDQGIAGKKMVAKEYPHLQVAQAPLDPSGAEPSLGTPPLG